jgi:hypothetical protein
MPLRAGVSGDQRKGHQPQAVYQTGLGELSGHGQVPMVGNGESFSAFILRISSPGPGRKSGCRPGRPLQGPRNTILSSWLIRSVDSSHAASGSRAGASCVRRTKITTFGLASLVVIHSSSSGRDSRNISAGSHYRPIRRWTKNVDHQRGCHGALLPSLVDCQQPAHPEVSRRRGPQSLVDWPQLDLTRASAVCRPDWLRTFGCSENRTRTTSLDVFHAPVTSQFCPRSASFTKAMAQMLDRCQRAAPDPVIVHSTASEGRFLFGVCLCRARTQQTPPCTIVCSRQ